MGRASWPTVLVLGWVLLFSRDSGLPFEDWERLGDYPYQSTCTRVLQQEVENDTLAKIGSVLASQPADNPLRRQAYARARRTMAARYRCRWR